MLVVEAGMKWLSPCCFIYHFWLYHIVAISSIILEGKGSNSSMPINIQEHLRNHLDLNVVRHASCNEFVVENGIGNPGSSLGQGCLHFTLY